MPVHHKWQPITDLQVAPELLADDGLRTMLLVWQEQKDDIATPEEMRAFDEKLRREWAVHTGLIERIYALDRGVTEMLIERGIEEALIPHRPGQQLPEITAAIINDHKNVVDGLFDFVADKRQITTSYIKELHNALVQNQHTATGVDKDGNRREVPLIKGDYKKHPNNPTRPDGKLHEFCPPEHVNSEMDNLIKMHGKHIAKGIAPEVSAAWLHHRFTQIHPFQDGNGRVARCLATIIFLRARGFPLTIRDINGGREKYLDALEAADRGNLQPLVSVFAESQRREFTRAINISRDIVSQAPGESHQDHTKRIIESAARKIAAHKDTQNKEWDNSRIIARRLSILSVNMLHDACGTLTTSISPAVTRHDGFSVEYYHESDPEYRGGDFFVPIDTVTKQHGYRANLTAHHEWSRLVLHPNNERFAILVSFHGVGQKYRGVVACSVCFVAYSADTSHTSRSMALTDEAFQINYQDSKEEVEKRFRPWLEKAIERGLALWHESL